MYTVDKYLNKSMDKWEHVHLRGKSVKLVVTLFALGQTRSNDQRADRTHPSAQDNRAKSSQLSHMFHGVCMHL